MITRHSDLALFRARVEPRLIADEAQNNLILGLLADAKADSDILLVETDDGVALRTAFNLIITAMSPATLDALVDHLSDVKLPGVVGPGAASAHFARVWSARHGLPARMNHGMRVFENRRLLPPRAPADGGQMRAAGESDLSLVVEWVEAFSRDVGATAILPRAALEERVRRGDFALWQTDRVVSMAAITRRTPNGAALAYVYTPPSLRGRGYASACVAALTQTLHDAGRACFLFTDLANPTSNKIYQAIGYRAVGDVEEWRFD